MKTVPFIPRRVVRRLAMWACTVATAFALAPATALANPYAYGQCTWYVYERAGACGGMPVVYADAGDWYDRAPAYGLAVGRTPKVNSIVVFDWTRGVSWGVYGHVAWVEGVHDGLIDIAETNVVGMPAGYVNRRSISSAIDPGAVAGQGTGGIIGYIYVAGSVEPAPASAPEPVRRDPPRSGRGRVRIADGDYVLRSAVGGKVLDIPGASTDMGASAQIWQPNGGAAQIFRVGWNDELDANNIRLAQAGNENRWLDAEGGWGAANVQQWEGNGSDAQNWWFEDAGDGWYYICNRHGFYLDVDGAEDRSGANVQVWEFNGSAAQRWKPVRVSGATKTRHASGAFVIRSGIGAYNLAIPFGSSAEGFEACVEPAGEGASQVFTIGWNDVLEANNIHIATSAGNEMWLDACGDGERGVQQEPGDGGQQQNWFFEDAGDGRSYIRNILGYYLEAEDSGDVRVAQFDGSDRQKWETAPAQAKIDISAADVSGLGRTWEYSGSAVEPKPVLQFNHEWLVEGRDYTLTYEDNSAPGTGTVVITGIGSYTGTLMKRFEIEAPGPAGIDISSASVVVDVDDGGAMWTGSAVEPRVTVTLGGVRLVSGRDYVLSYFGNAKPGVASVVVGGRGDYTGEATATFAIGRAKEPDPEGGIPVSDPDASWPAASDHWVDWGDGTLEGARWYVYRDGELRRSCWVELGGTWYYLGASGEMWVGKQWLEYQGKSGWYFFNPVHDGSYGRMRTGWFQHQGGWYYMEPRAGSGVQGMAYVSRAAVIDGRQYVFDGEGRMV